MRIRESKGQSLIISIIVIVAIILLVSVAILLTLEVDITASFGERDRKQALAAAEAGLADGRFKLLRNPSSPGCASPGCTLGPDLLSPGASVTYTIEVGSGTAEIAANGRFGSANRRVVAEYSIDSIGRVKQIDWREEQP